MGSETSNGIRDNSLFSNNIDSLDIDGIKTTEESSIDEETKAKDINYEPDISRKIDNKSIQISSNKVPVTFEWDRGGNSVYVSGNFCNWKQFFLMEKNSSGSHFLTLNLAKGLIQYKFKVDDQWKCNEKFPIINDNGNKNNYIDTTDWVISAEKSEEEYNNIKTNSDTNTDLSSKHKFNKSFNLQKNYSNYIPQANELNNFAPRIPEQYKPKICYSKETRQDKIGNKLFLITERDNLFGENYSYKKIKYFKNEEINHITFKLKNINKKPIVSSIVSRYRLKFTSFVYYK